MDKKRLSGHILAAATIMVWGTTFIASKVLLEYYSPAVVMLMRFGIAYIVLFAIRPRFFCAGLKDELKLLACGVLGCSLYFLCENTALNYTQASNVSILLASAPIFTSVLAHFFTRDEKFHRELIFGFIIAFAGVALVVFNGAVILKLSPAGDLLSLAAALCWASYSVLLKKLLTRHDILLVTRRIALYGIVSALPMLAFESRPFSLAPFAQPVNIFCILFLGVLGSGVCYVAWNIAVSRLGVVTTNSYIYLNPFITMLAAWLLLSEKITVMGIIGAVMIVLGVFLSGRSSAAGTITKARQQRG